VTYRPEDQQRLQDALAGSRRDRFDPGFADRAVARWRAERALTGGAADTVAFSVAVTRLFLRLAPPAAAAVLVLAVHNVGNRCEGQTIAQALIGASTESEVSTLTYTNAAPGSLDAIYGLGTITVPHQE
jgi:hypothetical protein